MEYHQPDSRWEIFGLPNFETYRQSLVVKGLFHLKVPKDVVESFVLCEYMMVHAWYHYPLYDEAVSKLLRILEMAVKLRCKELGISLLYDYADKKTKETKQGKKKFHQLINDLEKKEPDKKLKTALDRLRSLRNLYMHPEQYGFSGIAGRSIILFGVTILNLLFVSEEIMLRIEAETKRIEGLQANFTNSLCFISINSQRILVDTLEILGSVQFENGWRYLMAAHPVLDLPESEEFTYPVPMIAEVHSIEFKDDKLHMVKSEDEQPISIEKTKHPDNISKYQTFSKRKASLEESDKWIYKTSVASEISKRTDEFWYR